MSATGLTHTPYQPPVKRSVAIAGHETSISLEPLFWDALRLAAAENSMPLNTLVAHIDAERLQADTPPNLASAIRVWLFAKACAQREPAAFNENSPHTPEV